MFAKRRDGDKRDVEIAANKAAQDLGYAALKPKQLEVVSGVLRGQDVFAYRRACVHNVNDVILLGTTSSVA